MIEKLQDLLKRFDQLNELVADPSREDWKNLCKERSALEPVVEAINKYKAVERDLQDAETMRAAETDAELIEYYDEIYYSSKKQLETLEDEIKILLLPQDPNDNKNVIVEIRAAAGGDEAGLFGAELARMYKMYADKNRWKIEDIDINETEAGGIKEVSFSLSGNMIYSKLKFESGVHRVQRVPETETQGRVHTSTVTVAVLPEADEVEVEILEKDLKIDTYRSGGAGGQHVNKTESSIRITHLPSGLIVTCQDERSQIKNRDKAMKTLRARLYDLYQTQANSEYAAKRKGQVGTGDRSERIRTYNFPQGRVTDHRIGLTLYSIDRFMLGDIDDMLDALRADHQAKLLAAQTEE